VAAALLDLVDLVAPSAGAVGVDLGAYEGRRAAVIAERHHCPMVALDVAPTPLRVAPSLGVTPLNADLQRLPFRDSSLALVWCRDTLSMVPDVRAAVAEVARVLQRGAGAVLYTAVTTDRFEPAERKELVEALSLPTRSQLGRQPIDEALNDAGLEIVHEERYGPEFQEAALLRADGDLLHDLAVRGRFEREEESLNELISPVWARRFRAWADWPLYLLLGKLQTFAWVVRRT